MIRRDQDTSEEIQCCIVQDHHQVVRFLQSCWRAKLFPHNKLELLHYDSHPDIAILRPEKEDFMTTCTSTPSPDGTVHVSQQQQQQQQQQAAWREWLNMRSLPDRLDSRQGIAEWILPLTGAGGGHFERVLWVKPTLACGKSWCHQFECGEYRYHVVSGPRGLPLTLPEPEVDEEDEDCAVVRTDLNHSYYLDEGDVLFAAHGEVQRGPGTGADGEVCMCVGTSAVHACSFASRHAPETGSERGLPWVLDICLDFFSCSNPFRQELHRLVEPSLRRAQSTGPSASWERACLLLDSSARDNGDGELKALCSLVLDALTDTFRLQRYRSPQHSAIPLETHSGGDHNPDVCESINACNRRLSLDIIRQAFTNGSDVETTEHWQALRRIFTPGPESDRVLAALPALLPLLPEDVRALAVSYNSLLLLPHHAATTEDVVRLVGDLGRDLGEIFTAAAEGGRLKLNSAPCVVTIARSSAASAGSGGEVDQGATTTTEDWLQDQDDVSDNGRCGDSDGGGDGGGGGGDYTPPDQVEFIQQCVMAAVTAATEFMWRPGGQVGDATRFQSALQSRLDAAVARLERPSCSCSPNPNPGPNNNPSDHAIRFHQLYLVPEERYDAHVYSLFLHAGACGQVK